VADGTQITAGSGTTIATDDTGATGHAQIIKPAISADGSATLIPSDAANGLDVDVTRVQGTVTVAGNATVSGTVTTSPPANASTNVAQVGGTATDTNSGVKSAGTQRVVLATDQPALTNALKVDGSAVTQPVSGSVTANIGSSGSLALDATLTGGTQKTKIVDSGGTTVATVTAANALKVDGSAVTQPVSGTVTTTPPSNASTNVAQLAGTTTDTNSGTKGAGTLRVVLATDQPQLTNKLLVTPDANAQVDVNRIAGTATDVNSGNKSAGTQRVVIATDQPTPTNPIHVDDNSGSLTVDAPVGTPVFATATPSATGGWSKAKYAAQTTSTQTVKATAGTFGGYYVYNPNATVAYVQVFDLAAASAVTLGTTVPDMIFGIPATSAANLEITNGVNMANGVKLACTTTATGNTAPGTGLDISVWFK
jgi:hypothetical protein